MNQKEINDLFVSLFDKRQPVELFEPITYTLVSGGKRLRPMLTLMGCEIFGGDAASVVPVMRAVEMFHNFTLLHDDIMDNSPTRRGKPTVHMRWDKNTAILSGDAMLIAAYEQLQQMPEMLWPRLMRLFTQTGMEICKGQQYDKNFETRDDVSRAEYLEMIRLKTAVLLGGALKLGAVAAYADEDEAQRLYNVGIALGMAFQLQDDYLDLYGDATTLGKPIGGDILCNKKTFLRIVAREQADTATRSQLQHLLADGSMQPQQRINGVRALYDQLQVPQACDRLINEYMGQCTRQIDAIRVDEALKTPLRQLVADMLHREK